MTEPRELSYLVSVEVLAEVTDDEWQLVELAIGIDRGWGWGLPAGLQPRPSWAGHPISLTDA